MPVRRFEFQSKVNEKQGKTLALLFIFQRAVLQLRLMLGFLIDCFRFVANGRDEQRIFVAHTISQFTMSAVKHMAQSGGARKADSVVDSSNSEAFQARHLTFFRGFGVPFHLSD